MKIKYTFKTVDNRTFNKEYSIEKIEEGVLSDFQSGLHDVSIISREILKDENIFVFTKEELDKRDNENFELGRASFENQIGKEKASEWYGSMKVKPSDK